MHSIEDIVEAFWSRSHFVRLGGSFELVGGDRGVTDGSSSRYASDGAKLVTQLVLRERADGEQRLSSGDILPTLSRMLACGRLLRTEIVEPETIPNPLFSGEPPAWHGRRFVEALDYWGRPLRVQMSRVLAYVEEPISAYWTEPGGVRVRFPDGTSASLPARAR